MPSSVRTRRLPLALVAVLAFTLSATRAIAGQTDELRPAEREQNVGPRMAADLQWTQAERDSRFGHMDRLFPVHVVRRGGAVRALPAGEALGLPESSIRSYMDSEHVMGLLVLQDGHIRLERYAHGLTPSTLWTGFSMTKAMTDTLAGSALRAGQLRSLDDNVAAYLPEMKGSAYDGVSVRQLMTMTTGVRWNENYTSADADNVRLYASPVAAGRDATLEYMRGLHREYEPGSRWHYNTGETDLLGVLLRRATKQTLAGQLSATAWRRAGMERDATWIASASGPAGEEFGGSGLSATLRDWGRLGLWVMRGGDGAVPQDWFAQATRAQTLAGGTPYGYGWWPQGDDGSFAAIGIFGQSILIDPQRRLVIVTLADWPEATGTAHSRARSGFWAEVRAAVDTPTASPH